MTLATQFVVSAALEHNAAIAMLKVHETEPKRLRVQSLYRFGSTAHGEAPAASDLDLFFDYENGKFGLFDLMDVKQRASAILRHRTDIMTRDSLHRILKDRIEPIALKIF